MLKDSVHIDLSKKFWEKGNTGIAAINSDKGFHRGIAISMKIKKVLRKNSAKTNYTPARLYAVCIWKLVKEDLNTIGSLIICNDAPFEEVKFYLKHLTNNQIEIKSLLNYRKELNKKLKSLADSPAKSYRKKALKPWKLQNPKFNSVRIKYKEIILLLEQLNELDKKNR